MATSTTPAPLVRAVDEGDRRAFFGGGVQIWKAHADETNGAFHLFEHVITGSKATPLHVHPESDETMYVLEGEIVMQMDGDDHRVAAGGLAFAPRGVPHAFMTASDTVRMLCLHTPGVSEAFYLDASEPVDEDANPGAVDFDRVRASAQKNPHDIEIIGPPPFAPPASA